MKTPYFFRRPFLSVLIFSLAIPLGGMARLSLGGYKPMPSVIDGKKTVVGFQFKQEGKPCPEPTACFSMEQAKNSDFTPKQGPGGIYYVELPGKKVMAADSLEHLKMKVGFSMQNLALPFAFNLSSEKLPAMIDVSNSQIKDEDYFELMKRWTLQGAVSDEQSGCVLMQDIAKFSLISCNKKGECQSTYRQTEGVQEKLMARYKKWVSSVGEGQTYCQGQSFDQVMEIYRQYGNSELDSAIKNSPGLSPLYEEWRIKLNARFDSLVAKARPPEAKSGLLPGTKANQDFSETIGIDRGCAKFSGSWTDVAVTMNGFCSPSAVLAQVRSQVETLKVPCLDREKWSTLMTGNPQICNLVIKFRNRIDRCTSKDLDTLRKELDPDLVLKSSEKPSLVGEASEPEATPTDFPSARWKVERFKNSLFTNNFQCAPLYQPETPSKIKVPKKSTATK